MRRIWQAIPHVAAVLLGGLCGLWILAALAVTVGGEHGR